jgi:membrane protease YdiL (CAAX protease family)
MYPAFSDHVLLWIFGLVLPFLSGWQSQSKLAFLHFSEATRRKFYFSNSLVLGAMAAITVLNWLWHKRDFEEMGFRQSQLIQHYWPLAALILGLYLADVVYSIRNAQKYPDLLKKEDFMAFLPERWREIPAYSVMCISAAVFEEIVFRGFMVTYFIDPASTDIPWIAIFFPAILFGMAHYYQGLAAVLKIFVLSLLLAILFIQTKSLIWVMIIHFIIDFSGGLIAVVLPKK